MDTRNLSIIFGPTLLQPRDATVVGMVKDMSSQCQIVESIVLHHEWMFGAYNNPSDVIDGTECPADVILQVSTVDRLMLETAQNMAAKEEKDGDLRRLMRRVANRTKSSRRQRSKSALGHLQSIRSENNVDDVATAAAEKHKLSNDELQTASLPHKDKHKPNEMSPNLPDKHKNSLSADELKQAEKSHQHKERIGRSPTLRTRTVVSSTEKMKSRSTRPLVSLHPPQHSMSRRMAPNTLATIPRSYCGINSRSESILLFPAHSRDIFLKRSRERLASGSSSSGLIISSTGRSGGRGIGDSFSGEKSALAYLGSSSRAETSLLRRNVARNRAAHLIGCWQQSDSYPREEPKRSSFTGHETHTSSLDQKNDVEVLERAKSSNSLHSPLLTSAAMGPLLVFKKADHSYDMSPLSLSVQCGSDTDELEGAREVAVVPTHRLMSKRVWNTKACSWEDAVEHYSTDSLYSNCDSPDHYNSSDNAFLTMNQDSRKMVFAKPDIVVNTGARLCKEGVKCFASENDIARFSSRNDADIHCMPSSLSVKKAAVNATSTVDTPAKTRHSVIGIISDENHVFNCDQKTIVHLYRAKSCPELVALCQLVDSVHSVSAISHLHHRHKTPRHLNSVKKSTSKGSFRRRKAKQIVSHCTLSPPFASWPGKGDVMGSMLAYESSV